MRKENTPPSLIRFIDIGLKLCIYSVKSEQISISRRLVLQDVLEDLISKEDRKQNDTITEANFNPMIYLFYWGYLTKCLHGHHTAQITAV